MIRKTKQISTRQPLQKVIISLSNPSLLSDNFIEIIKTELNTKEAEINKIDGDLLVNLDTNISPELKAEGDMRDFIRQIQSLRKEAKLELTDKIKIMAPIWPTEFESEILSKVLGISIEKSDTLKIEKI